MMHACSRITPKLNAIRPFGTMTASSLRIKKPDNDQALSSGGLGRNVQAEDAVLCWATVLCACDGMQEGR